MKTERRTMEKKVEEKREVSALRGKDKVIRVLFTFFSFIFSFVFAFPLLAAEVEGGAAVGGALAKFGLAIGAGIGLGLAAGLGGLAQGKAVSSAMEGISRNPGASDRMFLPLILGLVFIESLVIYMLVIAFFLQGKI